MWSEVLGLALLAALNPMLLGLILLVISRPRPAQNLFVYWVGCLIVNVPAFLVSLMVLRWVPAFASFARDMSTADPGSSIKPFQLTVGVVALSVAGLMVVRLWVRRRTRVPAPLGAGAESASVLVLDSDEATADSLPQGPLARVRAASRTVFRRGRDAWDNGALWVALVFGMGYLPPPPLVLLVDTVVVGSGATVGTQVVAVIAFVLVMLAMLEVVLIVHLVAPSRTQAVLRPVHEWALDHRQHVLIALFTLVGLLMVLTGTGSQLA